jgi:DNA-directed RNA polymerase subunit RPC12/RpoP
MDRWFNSANSGLGLDGRESPKRTIHGQEYEVVPKSCPEFPLDSTGEFKSNANFDTSADIPIGQTYECDLCDESARSIFYSFNDLRRHKEAKHEIIDHIREASSAVPKETVSKTASLFREPSTPSTLPKQNAASSAKSDAPFQCPMCDSKFSRKDTLTNHLRTHTGDRPYECHECGKRFTRKDFRDRHQRGHGKKPFICVGLLKDGRTWGCGASFARQDRLTDHFRSKKGRKCLRRLLREKLQTADGSGLVSDDNMFVDQTGENADILLNAGKSSLPFGEFLRQCGLDMSTTGVPSGDKSCDDIPFSSNASVFPSHGIDLRPLRRGIRSPSGSETTDSGDSEMHADEESLFDDQDAHLYFGRKWNESTIKCLERIYKQKVYSLVGLRVLQHCNPHQEYGSSSSHVSACVFQSGPENGTSSGKKRKQDDISHEGNHGDHDDSNGDGDGSQEPSKRLKASKSEDRALRFACPFFKRHPESFRVCGMSDHENSSRVKQHISRKHRMPIYCPRCSETFNTEHNRDTHVRDADCPVGPKADFICATAEQLRKLGRRSVRQTDRDNWNAIYKTLFPDDPLPESPYLDPLVSYEVNLIREAFLTAAPVAVQTAIQHVIPEELSDTLQEELERILRSTHAEVFDQILRRMREDRESPRVDHTTTQSSSQIRVSSTPDSGIRSTIRAGSSQDEPELTLNSQDRLNSFGSGSFDLQTDGAIPFLPLFPPGFDSSDYHMGHIPQSFPAGTFGDFSEYLESSGDSSVTD